MFEVAESDGSVQDATSVCLRDENPHRLVSLWYMIKAYGYSLSTLASAIASFENVSAHVFQRRPDGTYHDHDQKLAKFFFAHLKASVPIMQELHLSQSSIYAERLMRWWEKDNGLDVVIRQNMISVLLERLNDELKSTFFLYVPGELAKTYKSPREGWEDVIDRFPESAVDIEEMNKCFAFSRTAAAVFHSVNAIECGLLELGKFLKVSDPKSGWTAVSSRLDSLVTRTKFPDLDPTFKAHFPFLEQLHGTVSPLKNAWRNKISHAYGRLTVMTADFSPEVAEEIIFATRSFMRRLATEMP